MKKVNDEFQKGFSVKATCQRLGIGPHTLRAWETRYQAVAPSRTEKGQRVYTEAQVVRLENIVRLVNFGHAVGLVAHLPDKELHVLLKSAMSEKNSSQSPKGPWPLAETILNDLLAFNLESISRTLDQNRTALGGRGFILEILTPLMQLLGELISKEKLSIAHEHAISVVIRDQIYQTLRYGARSERSKETINFVLATPEDDLHEFGILMSATLLSHYGLQNHLMGANLPAASLSMAVKAVRGKVILLGNAPIPDSERKVSFEEYLRELHQLLPKTVAIWIGGQGKVPHLRTVLPGREYRHIESLHEFDSIVAKYK